MSSLPRGELFWSNAAARIYGYAFDVQPTIERFLARTVLEERHIVQASIEHSMRLEGVVDVRRPPVATKTVQLRQLHFPDTVLLDEQFDQ